MIDKKTLIITALIGIIILIAGAYAYTEVKEKNYEKGFTDGRNNFYNQLIAELSDDGAIIIPVQTENGIQNVKLIISRE